MTVWYTDWITDICSVISFTVSGLLAHYVLFHLLGTSVFSFCDFKKVHMRQILAIRLETVSKTMCSIECQVYRVGETSHMAEISKLCTMVMFDTLLLYIIQMLCQMKTSVARQTALVCSTGPAVSNESIVAATKLASQVESITKAFISLYNCGTTVSSLFTKTQSCITVQRSVAGNKILFGFWTML